MCLAPRDALKKCAMGDQEDVLLREGLTETMSKRFYPGDPCPNCPQPIQSHGRTIWTVFLREPFLKCPNCKQVFRRFPRRQTTPPPRHSGRREPFRTSAAASANRTPRATVASIRRARFF